MSKPKDAKAAEKPPKKFNAREQLAMAKALRKKKAKPAPVEPETEESPPDEAQE